MIRIISALLLSFLISNVALADKVKLAENAPDSYTVVKGDTLWDISGRFLQHPWRWPEVWRMNREQIRNPHWIYPGQTIYLDRSGPYLSLNKPGEEVRVTEDGRLKPKVYEEGENPIASVNFGNIEQYLTSPLVFPEEEIPNPAVIIASDDGRVNSAKGDTVFAKNVTAGVSDWQIFRRAGKIVDPVTQEVLGYEAEDIGAARVVQDGAPATLTLMNAKREVSPGDRMLPAPKAEILSFVPHVPTNDIAGRVVKLPLALQSAGKNSVVILNVGRVAGIERGHVLALYRNRGEVDYKLDGKKEHFKLPDNRYGLIFVFRVFEKVSYGLVVDANMAVRIADTVGKP